MPYSTLYILDQLARGKPAPTGSPDPELFNAINAVSPMDIESALRKGAKADARDARGMPAIHALLSNPRLDQHHPDRILACARALLRNRTGLAYHRNPVTRATALEAAACRAGSPGATAWYLLWQRIGDWHQPASVGGTITDVWRAAASDELKAHLPTPRTRKPGP